MRGRLDDTGPGLDFGKQGLSPGLESSALFAISFEKFKVILHEQVFELAQRILLWFLLFTPPQVLVQRGINITKCQTEVERSKV